MANPTAPRCEPAPDTLPRLCESCLARHRGICGALTGEQLRRLNATSSKRHASAGTELAPAGEPTTHFANLLAGVVKLSRMLPDGRRQIVGLQFAPDFVGRPFSGENAVAAEAVTDVQLCSFPRRTLEAMIEESPGLERKLHAQALAELDEARELLLTLGCKSARERVATFLLLLADHQPHEVVGDGDELALDLPMGRAEIAAFLGLTIETVSRQLTALKRDGLIRLEGLRRIRVPDRSRLEAIAGD